MKFTQEEIDEEKKGIEEVEKIARGCLWDKVDKNTAMMMVCNCSKCGLRC